ncbi:MAG: hypothetical protein HY722_09745 [Planctomycetes bacterium]|nr:hypothetical protein [Planctomycetota bacterium]
MSQLRVPLVLVATVALAPLSLLPVPARAQEEAPLSARDLIDLEVREERLDQVLRHLARRLGRSLVLETPAEQLVSFSFKQRPAGVIFDTLLEAYGLYSFERGGIVRVRQALVAPAPADPGALEQSILQMHTRAFSRDVLGQIEGLLPRRLVYRVVADPDTGEQRLASTEEVLGRIRTVPENERAVVVEAPAAAIARIAAYVKLLDGERTQVTMRLNAVGAQDFSGRVKSFLSAEGEVVVNKDSNSVTVIDYPSNLEQVRRFAEEVDRDEPQVLIESKLLEVALRDEDTLGVSYAIKEIQIDDVTGRATLKLPAGSLGADSFAGIISTKGDAIAATVEMLARKRNVAVLASPRVTTVNKGKANINVTTDVPYVQQTTSINAGGTGTGGTGTTTAVQSVSFKTVGITLDVTPEIRPNNTIVLDVAPEVSEVTERFQGVPVVDSRKITTKVLIPDGATLILGGVLRENRLLVKTKVPVLGDIPFLGVFFRKTEQTRQKTELVMFLRPTILSPTIREDLNEEALEHYDEGSRPLQDLRMRKVK